MSEVDVSSMDDVNTKTQEELIMMIRQLQIKLSAQETDFGEKRALMKDLFLKKENELSKTLERIENLTRELEDVRSAANILESGREDESSRVVEQYEAQVTSLQTILDESMHECSQLASEKESLLIERKHLLAEIKKLKVNTATSNASYHQSPTRNPANFDEHVQQESSVSTSKKPTIDMHFIEDTVFTGDSQSAERLEALMEQAIEDRDRLRLVVQPYEEEVASLTEKLYQMTEELQALSHAKEMDSHRIQVLDNLWRHSTQQYLSWREQNLSLLLRVSSLLSNTQLDALHYHLQAGQKVRRRPNSRYPRLSTGHKEGAVFQETPPFHEFILKRRSMSVSSHDMNTYEDPPPHSSPLYRTQSDEQLTKSCGDNLVSSIPDISDQISRNEIEISLDFRAKEQPMQEIPLSNQGDVKDTAAELKCSLCNAYQERVVMLQERCQDVERKLVRVEDQLKQETNAHAILQGSYKNLTRQLQRQCATHAQKIVAFETSIEDMNKRFKQCMDKWTTSGGKLKEMFDKLKEDRIKMKEKYSSFMQTREKVKSEELRNQSIMLPSHPDDLQLFALQMREKTIDLLAAKEHLEDMTRSEGVVLRDQISSNQRELQAMRSQLRQKEADLRTKVAAYDSVMSEYEKLKTFCESYHGNADQLAKENQDYRLKVQSLLADLQNSESVQRDFVQLSQRLQMQLEKFRQEESSEVRWQHEEDVQMCNECKCNFVSLSTLDSQMNQSAAILCKRKLHCRHCGKIFCGECLNKTVLSGPARKPARVCKVCHTMLVKDAVPYFSVQSPSQTSPPNQIQKNIFSPPTAQTIPSVKGSPVHQKSLMNHENS